MTQSETVQCILHRTSCEHCDSNSPGVVNAKTESALLSDFVTVQPPALNYPPPSPPSSSSSSSSLSSPLSSYAAVAPSSPGLIVDGPDEKNMVFASQLLLGCEC